MQTMRCPAVTTVTTFLTKLVIVVPDSTRNGFNQDVVPETEE